MQSKAKDLILKNTFVLFAGQLTTWALTILFSVYVARRVGTYGWGELTIAWGWTTIASTLAALGIGTLMVRDMARTKSKVPALVGVALMTRIVLALPCLAVIVFLAWLIYPSQLHTQVVIDILSVGMVVQLLTGPFQAGFQALERMKYNSLSDVITKAIVSLVSIAMVLLGRGIILISIVSTLASIVVLILNVLWWRPLGRLELRLDWKLFRYLVVGGLPFWATGIFLTIYLYIDSLMLSKLANSDVVGWYGAPTKLFSTLLFIPVILSTAMFPALSRTFKRAPREMVKMARRSFNLLTCFSLPVAVGGMLLSKQIILLLYGQEYTPSIPIMVVLSATLVPTYLNILVNQFLVAADRQIAWTKVMAAACVLNPAINFVLINFYQRTHGNGAFGAGLALLITEALMTIAGIALLPRGVLGWSNVVSMVKSCAAVGLMALAIWYTHNYFIAIPIAVGAVVYAVAGLALGAIPRQDFNELGQVAGKVLRKLGVKRAMPAAPAQAN
ncbi:MAG TPA: flippase [Ktedonobacterales bacterium]|jgi:O-antigen/teichoic acid export membrane protein